MSLVTELANRTLTNDRINNCPTMVDGIIKAVVSIFKSTEELVSAKTLSKAILPIIQAKLQEHLQGEEAVSATAALYVLDLTGDSIICNTLALLRGDECMINVTTRARVITWKKLSFWQRICACLKIKI